MNRQYYAIDSRDKGQWTRLGVFDNYEKAHTVYRTAVQNTKEGEVLIMVQISEEIIKGTVLENIG